MTQTDRLASETIRDSIQQSLRKKENFAEDLVNNVKKEKNVIMRLAQ
jgi:hypothetical protein